MKSQHIDFRDEVPTSEAHRVEKAALKHAGTTRTASDSDTRLKTRPR